jgi:hypothetical protein
MECEAGDLIRKKNWELPRVGRKVADGGAVGKFFFAL